jgi:hypothetical protein
MPTTQQLVSLIKEEYLPKWSRSRILYYLDWAQRELFKTDCDQHTFYNGADPVFPYPFLETTAGQFKYNINDTALLDSNGDALPLTLNGISTTCRKVNKVFVSGNYANPAWLDRGWYGEAFSLVGLNVFYSQNLYTARFFEVPIIIKDQVDSETPSITFAEDPGTQTARYYIELYLNPIPLSSEAIKLSVDSDMWEMALIDGTIGRAELAKNGRSEKYEMFMNVWKKRYKKKMSETSDKRTPDKFRSREAG